MEAWTDERLDDLAATLRPLPQEVARIGGAVGGLTAESRSMRDDMRSMRDEMRSVREDMRSMREDMRSMREDMRSMGENQSAFQRQLAQIGWSLAGALAVAMFALVIALV